MTKPKLHVSKSFLLLAVDFLLLILVSQLPKIYNIPEPVIVCVFIVILLIGPIVLLLLTRESNSEIRIEKLLNG